MSIFKLFLLFICINQLFSKIPEDISDLLGGKVLKVGTVSDIPPFSFFDKGVDEIQGIDVELCKLFVEQHYVEVEFIPTSWSTMIDELLEEKFHMIMCGISKNILKNNTDIKFSKTYLKTGRALVMRKKDIEKYKIKSFDDVNKPEMKVLVNEKSENEYFAKKYLKNSDLVYIKENENEKPNFGNKIKKILNKENDVLVTDYYEGLFYVGENEDLDLVVDPEGVDKEEIGAIFREGDDALRDWFDLLLESCLVEGTVDDLVNNFLQSDK